MNDQVCGILSSELATLLDQKIFNLLLVDSRSFLEYNDSHVIGSVNIQSSKLVRKRLEQNKISIVDLLENANHDQIDKVVVYDQSTRDISSVPKENFMSVIARKLYERFQVVLYLQGGFADFGHRFPKYCEKKQDAGNLFSISTPCITTRGVTATRILPFLYLGNEEDSRNATVLQSSGINFVMNVSATAADSSHVIATHYMKIPICDSFTENIVDWFQSAFDFIDRVRGCDGKVLVHCVGGVSRSATIAVGYVMKHMHLPLDKAYRFVKEKRPSISPNLNFMGQLLEYEKQLADQGDLEINNVTTC